MYWNLQKKNFTFSHKDLPILIHSWQWKGSTADFYPTLCYLNFV